MLLKKKSDPLLHDMFKSILARSALEVKPILARQIGGSLLKNWEFKRAYEEERSKRNKYISVERGLTSADVIWVLYHSEHEGERYIAHEVKTGYFDVHEVIDRYKGKIFHFNPYCNAVAPNSPLLIWGWWGWSEKIKYVKYCNLEWLLPILHRKLMEIIEEL